MTPESTTNSSRKRRGALPITRAEEWLVVALLLLVGYPMWVRGGTQVEFQGPLPWLAAVALLAAILARSSYERQRRNCSISRSMRLALCSLLKTPALYPGLLFLALLLVQWWNAGRELSFDIRTLKWFYEAPRIPGLPSAIKQEDAAEMLRWFFPAGCAVLAVKTGIVRKRTWRGLCAGIVALAAVLAALSTVQFALARGLGICKQPSDSYFVMSFGYPNHGGIFFNFVFCLGAGLLLETIFRSRVKRPGRRLLLSVAVALCFAGATVSLSRAALIVSWLLALSVGIYAFAIDWRKLSDGEKFSKGMLLVALACVVFFAVHGTSRHAIREEFLDGTGLEKLDDLSRDKIARDQGTYIRAMKASDTRCRDIGVRIWQDHLWLGAGGWAQRHLAAFYLPPEQWSWACLPGKANTHSDPIQFLGEFGIVGFGLMLVCYLCLIGPVFLHEKEILHPVPFFCVLGIHIVMLYSSVDLPFRSPAVVLVWVLVAAGLSGEIRRSGRRKADKEHRRTLEQDSGDASSNEDVDMPPPSDTPAGDKRVCV